MCFLNMSSFCPGGIWFSIFRFIFRTNSLHLSNLQPIFGSLRCSDNLPLSPSFMLWLTRSFITRWFPGRHRCFTPLPQEEAPIQRTIFASFKTLQSLGLVWNYVQLFSLRNYKLHHCGAVLDCWSTSILLQRTSSPPKVSSSSAYLQFSSFFFLKVGKMCAESVSVSTCQLPALFTVISFQQKESVDKWIELNLSSKERQEAHVITSSPVRS